MHQAEFTVADPVDDRNGLIELNTEYMNWVFAEMEAWFGIPANSIVGMPASEYVPTVIDKICGDPPPKAVFYLVQIDGELAGMGGFRYLRPAAAEVKRIYFRPKYRGQKLGEQMLKRLISDARDSGYTSLHLDSAPFMTSAHRAYEACGFADCAPYEETEVPKPFHSRWRFMHRSL